MQFGARTSVLLLLALAGCASSPVATPYAPEVYDPGQYNIDLQLCAKYALAAPKPAILGSIGEATLKGAAQNAAGAAVNPLVPVLGAAGGGTSALLDALNILTTRQRTSFLICIDKKTVADHSALVIEPE